MQIKSLRIQSYNRQGWRKCRFCRSGNRSAVGRLPIPPVNPAIDRMRKPTLYAELKSAGGTMALCSKTIGGSKATCCRWLDRYRRRGWRGLESQSRCPKRVRGRQWTTQRERQVLHLRRGYPLRGQTQALEGVVQGSGSEPQPQHGLAHPGPAGALEAGQAQRRRFQG